MAGFLSPRNSKNTVMKEKERKKKSEEKERWIRKQAMVTLLVCKNNLLMRVPNPIQDS